MDAIEAVEMDLNVEQTPEAEVIPASDPSAHDWHAGAGRKGAVRVHQLIKKGRLYEEQHGLSAKRQRLKQLIELGKLYEVEHGQARPETRRFRLSRMDRGELLAMLLQLLARFAKPSFRDEIDWLIEAEETRRESTV